ncbi:6865_t:CDS:1, partial [Funneliformis geosporum]
MNLLIFFLPFFSTLFVSYVVGFEFLNDISCAELTTQDNEILYSYDWKIKNFQDYYEISSNIIASDRIYSPIPSYAQNSQDKYFEWRLILNPNDGMFGAHISIGLIAIQTDYEKDMKINLKDRNADHFFELFVNYNNSDEKYQFVEKSQRLNYFHSSKYGVSSVAHNLVKVAKLFPNYDKLDLIVRINFYKIENNSVPLPIVINPYDQYFDDDVFSDILFTFNSNSTIKASSIFLATKSPHFKNLLEGASKFANKININMDGVSYDSFYRLLHYIYTGKLDDNLGFDELLDLYNEANLREIRDLKKLLSCRIIGFVDENNLDILFTLGFTTKNNVLKNAVLKFFAIGHTHILYGDIPYITSLPNLRDFFDILTISV